MIHNIHERRHNWRHKMTLLCAASILVLMATTPSISMADTGQVEQFAANIATPGGPGGGGDVILLTEASITFNAMENCANTGQVAPAVVAIYTANVSPPRTWASDTGQEATTTASINATTTGSSTAWTTDTGQANNGVNNIANPVGTANSMNSTINATANLITATATINTEVAIDAQGATVFNGGGYDAILPNPAIVSASPPSSTAIIVNTSPPSQTTAKKNTGASVQLIT